MRISPLKSMVLACLPLVAVAACTTSKSEAPALSGPSELGLSLAIAANPDQLTKDGTSQASIVVTARNANSQPAAGVALRLETFMSGALVDYGTLSTKNVTTGSDGRATVTYTAPAGASSGNSQADESVIEVFVTPVGSDFSNSLTRFTAIRLMPAGVILPPANRPIARFSFAPSSPTEGQDVAFDASASVDCSPSVTSVEACLASGSKTGLTYLWDFGDGKTGSGVLATHKYESLGSYSVSLTVSNSRGNSDRYSQFVSVGSSPRPTAAFTFSPNNPEAGQSVFFNAAGSQPAPGREITGYFWTFGDGGEEEGVTVTHRFNTPGTWTITLTVTDDIGRTDTISRSLTLGEDLVPTADFVASPTEAAVNQIISFDGRLSTSVGGRTLAKWEWAFGDGNTDEGERVQHRYGIAGEYSVVLTVTDSSGAKNSIAKTITVK